MTIATETSRTSVATGNGVTVNFDFNFIILDEDHVQVVFTDTDDVETILTLTTDYTVAGIGDAAGGTVTMVVAPATGEKITILRVVPYTQSVNLRNQGGFYPEVHEEAFDFFTMQVQQLAEQIDRAVLSPVSSGIDPTVLIATLTADAATAAASATAAAASQTAAAASAVTAAAAIPAVTGNALKFIRVNAGATAYEVQTPTQVIAALSSTLTALVSVMSATATAAAQRTALGSTSVGDALFITANAGAALTTLGVTANGQSLITAANYAAMKTLLSLTIGTDVLAYSAVNAALASVMSSTATAAAQRTALGLGTAATATTGTSGTTVPLLDGANTWSAAQIISTAAPDATTQLRFADNTGFTNTMTDVAAATIYAQIGANDTNNGGLSITGLNTSGSTPRAITMNAYHTTDNSTHSTAGDAGFRIFSGLRSGTGVTSPAAGANLFGVWSGPGTTLEFIVTAGGTLYAHAGGASPTDFHIKPDFRLVRSLNKVWGLRSSGDDHDLLNHPDHELIVGEHEHMLHINNAIRLGHGAVEKVLDQKSSLISILDDYIPGILADWEMRHASIHGDDPSLWDMSADAERKTEPSWSLADAIVAGIHNSLFDAGITVQ